MHNDSVKRRMISVLAQHTGLPKHTLAAGFNKTLASQGAESLDIVQAIIAMESEFGCEIANDAFVFLDSPGKIFRHLLYLLQHQR